MLEDHAWRAAGLCHEVGPNQRRPAPAPLLAKHEQAALPQRLVDAADDVLQLPSANVRRAPPQEVVDPEGRHVREARGLLAAPPAERAQTTIDGARLKALHAIGCWLAAYPKGVTANVEHRCHATPARIVACAMERIPARLSSAVSHVLLHPAPSFWPKAVRIPDLANVRHAAQGSWRLDGKCLSRNSCG